MFTSYTKEDLDTSSDHIQNSLVQTPEHELVDKYQLEKCLNWIRINNYRRTCLQLPENLLNDGTSIALYLQRMLERVVYILADTSYGSCCVDEVAAEHVDGDSVIHFGHACLSPVIRLPVLYVFEKKDLDLHKLKESIQAFFEGHVIIFYSDVYHYLASELNSEFEGNSNVSVSRLCVDGNTANGKEEKIVCGRIFIANFDSQTAALYVGEDSVTLQNLALGMPDLKWYRYTEACKIVEFELNRNKFLMRRSHLVEKIKEGNVLGILIGTLGVKNYLDAVERIKILAKKKGKKCYIFAVGKPNIAKLANFPEIDVFVCIACPENSLLKDFKDYYKPVVSLIEVEMALGDRPYSVEYTSDFRELLPGGLFYKKTEVSDFSLNPIETSQELMERHSGTLIESTGAEFLSNRTWRGLEQKVGETEVCKAVQGRRGIPQCYQSEGAMVSEEKHDS